MTASLFLGFPPFPSSTQPPVLLGENPPPYSPLTSPESGSAPVISCRVCQSLISVEGKIHQHVVKCGVCNEATVSFHREHLFDVYLLHWCTTCISFPLFCCFNSFKCFVFYLLNFYCDPYILLLRTVGPRISFYIILYIFMYLTNETLNFLLYSDRIICDLWKKQNWLILCFCLYLNSSH